MSPIKFERAVNTSSSTNGPSKPSVSRLSKALKDMLLMFDPDLTIEPGKPVPLLRLSHSP